MSGKKKYLLQSEKAGNTILFGLVTDEKEYKVSWLINQQLGLQLSRSDNVRWSHKKIPNTQEYTCYKDSSVEPGPIVLITNKSNEGLKLGEFKLFDYLIVFPNSEKDWKDSLRSISQIRGIYELDSTGIEELDLM